MTFQMNKNPTLIYDLHDPQTMFKQDVLEGLSQARKQIPSVYFYDDKGSQLFNKITKHPDYYLTNCEVEILNKNKSTISSLITDKSINLIEFGPGEGIKTSILIKQFLKDKRDFVYTPIDICDEYLTDLEWQFKKKFKRLNIEPKKANYLEKNALFSSVNTNRNFILFLGSSVGNFDPKLTHTFLKNLHNQLNPGDYLLIGFDLCKEIKILLNAYNDSSGITREFNLNLLKRINKELDGHFNINDFYHYGTYNVNAQVMESYLISLKQQTVRIESLKKTFDFTMHEPIHVENSYKYTLEQVEGLARNSGFGVVQHFVDRRNYFLNSLWRVLTKFD